MDTILKLSRPLAVIDLETTGLRQEEDRIIEIAIIKLHPDGREAEFCERVNPEVPIPRQVSELTGIRDEDVQGKPTFRAIAANIAKFLIDCDLAGFNVIDFDWRLLKHEFQRAGVDVPNGGRAIVDTMQIFHRQESRNLTAAARFYLNLNHADAHSALADARMSVRVLMAQLLRYQDIPHDLPELHAYCHRYLDSARTFEWKRGEAVVAFGRRYKGRMLRDVAQVDAEYLRWMLAGDFPSDTKQIVSDALLGRFPEHAQQQGIAP
jgi:DNA polymerase III subunit epsilon